MSHEPEKERWQELLADLDAVRAAEDEDWGGIDEETLALYIAGACSPEERVRIQAAMPLHPKVRELVEGLKKKPPEGWIRWVTAGAAAAILVGIGISLFIALSNRRMEVLVALVELRIGSRDGPGTRPLTRDEAGAYRIRPSESFRFRITPPRDGVAVVVRVLPEGWKLLDGELKVTRTETRRDPPPEGDHENVYGSIFAPNTRAVFLVVITEAPATGIIRDSLPFGKVGFEVIDSWKEVLLQRLREAGYKWAVMSTFTTTPADPE